MRCHRRGHRHGRSVVGTQHALPVLEHQQAQPHPRPRFRRGARPAAAAHRRERRGDRELLAARARQLRARVGADPRDQPAVPPRAHAGVRAVGPVARQRRASRRRWNRSPAWPGSPATVDDQPRIQRGPERSRTRGCTPRSRSSSVSPSATPPASGACSRSPWSRARSTPRSSSSSRRRAYGNLLERDGNRSPNVAPQGLYRGRDDETWLAISVATDEQWQASDRCARVSVVGRRARAVDHRRPARPARRARRPPRRLEPRLRTSAEAAELLVAHGVPAARRT